MRKILYLLMFIPFGVFGQTQVVNVGASANDHTGDPLRNAFIKVNTNFTAVRDSFGNIYREVQTRALVNDSLDQLRADALPADSYVFMMNDSNNYGGAITRNYFETYGGGGGGGGSTGGGYEWTQFIVGTTTGSPANADTSFTIAAFAGDRIELYRGTTTDLHRQWLNETATNGKTGYRYNSSGVIVVRPAWATGDRAYLSAVPAAYTDKVALTGTGGGSSLLTDLIAGWDFNEVSGNRAFEVQDNIALDGMLTGGVLINQLGNFGRAYDFDGTNDGVSMRTDAYLRPQTMSISVWVKTTMADYGAIVNNYRFVSGVAYGYGLVIFPDGTVEWGLRYAGDDNVIQSTTAVNDGNWHNIIATFDGTNTNIYIDDSATEATDATAGTIIYHTTNEFEVGIRDLAGDIPFDGTIDDIYIWDKVVSAGERTILQTYVYTWE